MPNAKMYPQTSSFSLSSGENAVSSTRSTKYSEA